MKPTTALLALAMLGCGRAPLNLPLCDASVTEYVCAPNQTRNGMQCATCTSANSTLTCQTAEHEAVLCVSSCSSCDTDAPPTKVYTPDALSVVGVHLCGYDSGTGALRMRDGAYCAICSTQDLSATMALCSEGDYTTGIPGEEPTASTTTLCDPVVCVHDCTTCPILH